MDFNTSSLANSWTQEDLRRQGLELREGMRCVFYDFDAEEGQTGFLHGIGVEWWDETSSQFRVLAGPDELRFTPGDELAVLDSEYP